MAEENGPENLPQRVYYDEGEYQSIVNSYQDELRRSSRGDAPNPGYNTAAEGLARGMLMELSFENPDDPNYTDYDAVLNGTAGIWNIEQPDLSVEERKELMAGGPRSIITYFGRDYSNRPIQIGDEYETLVEAGVRGTAKGLVDASLFLSGAKVGNDLMSRMGISPLKAKDPRTAMLALGARVGAPLITGMGAVIAGEQPREYITKESEKFLGREIVRDPLLVPGTERAYNVVKGIASDIPQGFSILGINTERGLGFANVANQYIKREVRTDLLAGPTIVVKDATGVVKQRLPVTEENEKIVEEILKNNPTFSSQVVRQFSDKGLKAYSPTTYYVPKDASRRGASGRGTVKESSAIRLSEGAENLIRGMVQDLKEHPYVYFLGEIAASTAGQSLAESSRSEGAGQLEQILAELGGNVLGGVTADAALRRLIPVVKASYGAVSAANQARKEYGIVDASVGFIKDRLGRRQAKQEEAVGQFLRDFIKSKGENPDPDVLFDAVRSGELRDAALAWQKANPGQPGLILDSADLSQSPALAAMRSAIQAGVLGGKREADAASKASGLTQGIELLIRGLYASGTPEALQTAARVLTDNFEAGLQHELDNAADRALNAVLKITGKKSYDELDINEKATVGEKIALWTKQALARDKAKAKYLYDRVDPELRVEQFINEKGEIVDVPNSVSFWSTKLDPETKHADRKALSELQDLINYSAEKAAQLNIPFNSKGLTPRSTEFEKAYAELEAFPEAQKAYASLVEINNWEDPTNDSIASILDWLSRNAKDSGSSRVTEVGDNLKIFKTDAEKEVLVNAVQAKRKELVELRNVNSSAKAAATTDDGGVTVRGLNSIRGAAQEIARNNPGTRAAALATEFAKAVKRDMDSLPAGVNRELDTARAFYSAYTDVYKKAFPAEVTGLKKGGVDVIDPDKLPGKIFEGSAGSIRFRAMEDISKFNAVQYMTTLFGGSGEDSQRLTASFLDTVINPETRTMDISKARKWLAENKSDLENLPGYEFVQIIDDKNPTKFEYTVQPSGTLYDSLQESLSDSLTLNGMLDNALRQIKAEAFSKVDPEDPMSVGQIDAAGVRRWMSKPENKEILNALPSLKADLEAILDGKQGALNLFLDSVQKQKDDTKKKKDAFSFYTLLPDKNENPVNAIKSALSDSKTPFANLDGLFQVIVDAPKQWKSKLDGVTYTKEEAMSGFRSSIIDYIMLNSGAIGGELNPLKAYRTLFNPQQFGEKRGRLADWLSDNKVFSEAELKNIESLLRQGAELNNQISRATSEELSGLVAKMGLGADIFVSTLGSAAGQRIAKLTGGESAQSLILTGRMARAARDQYRSLILNAPAIVKGEIIKRAMDDPEYMRLLLRKGKTVEEQNRAYSTFISKLIVDGLIVPPARRVATQVLPDTFEESPKEKFEREYEAKDLRSSVETKPVPVQTVSLDQRFTPPPPPRRPPTPAPVAQAPAPASNPMDRARLAAAFPNDPILKLMG